MPAVPPAERAPSPADRASGSTGAPWSSVRDRLRARGLRWTPQRRVLIDVLAASTGHVTVADLLEHCRAVDPATVPSTVYRTLDVLEELGLVSHSHRHDGREEFHVLPEHEHGHLECTRCGRTWELPAREAAAFIVALRESGGFAVNLSHLSVGGLCALCRTELAAGAQAEPRGADGGRPSSQPSASGTPRTLKPPST